MPVCSECKQTINIGDWPYCGKDGGHSPARGRDAQDFIPPVIFKNAEGNVLFPGRSDERPPAGYEAVELRTSAEVHRFEREFSKRLMKEHQGEKLTEQLRHDYYSAPKIKALKENLDRLPSNLRGYAERAIERADRRSISADAARHRPVAFFEAFHFDARNRERCDDPKSMSDRQRR